MAINPFSSIPAGRVQAGFSRRSTNARFLDGLKAERVGRSARPQAGKAAGPGEW